MNGSCPRPWDRRLGKPPGSSSSADVETLTRRITEPEQQLLDLRGEFAERDEDLGAAHAANRELVAQANR
ncbi:hypothetical protein [Streptomyces sp. NPDC048637]|uniref:hypothetical protein n=1 Tax=Streptomyces sp. NPDC048637 TaxID=3155636 RepID=UPI0034446F58